MVSTADFSRSVDFFLPDIHCQQKRECCFTISDLNDFQCKWLLFVSAFNFNVLMVIHV